jgi:two-component system nitrate/nitrite response regulator NarL
MSVQGAAAPRTRILVVVRVRLYREGMATVLRDEPRVELVGTVGSAGEALPAIAAAEPDVVLLDMSVPGAASLAMKIAKICGRPHAVALGIDETEDGVISSAEAGVQAFVNASDSVLDLIAIVEAATRGELVCSPRVAVILRRRVASMGQHGEARESAYRLTARERDVTLLLDEGLSNREIAERLSIEVSTVKNHVHNIFDKLKINHRWEVALRAHSVAESAWSPADSFGEFAPEAPPRQSKTRSFATRERK